MHLSARMYWKLLNYFQRSANVDVGQRQASEQRALFQYTATLTLGVVQQQRVLFIKPWCVRHFGLCGEFRANDGAGATQCKAFLRGKHSLRLCVDSISKMPRRLKLCLCLSVCVCVCVREGVRQFEERLISLGAGVSRIWCVWVPGRVWSCTSPRIYTFPKLPGGQYCSANPAGLPTQLHKSNLQTSII